MSVKQLKQHPYFPLILSLLNARDALYSKPDDLSLLLPQVQKFSDLISATTTTPDTDTTADEHFKNLTGILVSQITTVLTQHDDASRRLDELRLVNLNSFDHIIAEHERHHEDEKRSRKERASSKKAAGNDGTKREKIVGETVKVKTEGQPEEEAEGEEAPEEGVEGKEEEEEEEEEEEHGEEEEEEGEDSEAKDPTRRNASNWKPTTKRKRKSDRDHHNQNQHSIPFVTTTHSPLHFVPAGSSSHDEKRPKYRSNHPPWVGSYLKRWLFTHLDDPHPSTLEKEILAKRTGLSRPQISDWLVNARRRILPKATQAMMDRFIQMKFDFDDE